MIGSVDSCPSLPDVMVLRRLADNVITASAQGRDVYDVGPFRIFIDPRDPLRYYNYAVPVRHCSDWTEWLNELCAVFESHGRLPRFEYLTTLWPTLRSALESHGFVAEVVAPVMILPRGELRQTPPCPASLHFITPESPRSDWLDLDRVGRESFGLPEDPHPDQANPPPPEEPGSRLRALARVEGVAAACGVLMCTGDVAEMAGVATLPTFRRRGIAADLCYRLLKRGFDQGLDLVWLSAADDAAVSLYLKLGFQRAGDQLHISAGQLLP